VWHFGLTQSKTRALNSPGPQYSVQVRDWRTGNEVAADKFGFTNVTNAKKIDTADLGDVDELPSQFKGVTQ